MADEEHVPGAVMDCRFDWPFHRQFDGLFSSADFAPSRLLRQNWTAGINTGRLSTKSITNSSIFGKLTSHFLSFFKDKYRLRDLFLKKKIVFKVMFIHLRAHVSRNSFQLRLENININSRLSINSISRTAHELDVQCQNHRLNLLEQLCTLPLNIIHVNASITL